MDFILSESAYSALGPLVTLLPILTHTHLMCGHPKSQRMNSSITGKLLSVGLEGPFTSSSLIFSFDLRFIFLIFFVDSQLKKKVKSDIDFLIFTERLFSVSNTI